MYDSEVNTISFTLEGCVDGTPTTSSVQRQHEHSIDKQISISGKTPSGILPIIFVPTILIAARSVRNQAAFVKCIQLSNKMR